MEYKWVTLEEYWNLSKDLTTPWTAIPCKIVAVTGVAGDWTAYRGPADWTDEDVARRGDKIDREAAEILFPSMVHLGLRWRS
jgi:hypothetical protein